MRPSLNWEPGETAIPQGIVSRIASGLRMMVGKSPYNRDPVPAPIPFSQSVYGNVNVQITTIPRVDWFGPGQPFIPVAPPETAGRQYDFPSYSNIDIRQKPREGIDYSTLISLANSYDLLGLLIDTRKDQLCKLAWSVGYKDDDSGSKKADDRCKRIMDFLQSPDKEHDWQDWLRFLVDDMLVIDAPCVYPRMTNGGELYSLEVMDGSTIIRVIDNWGRTPLPPDPAYQQVLKGLPAVSYTKEQLIFKPRNTTTRRLFGLSPVERIVMTVQTALRKQLYELQYFTDGSTPDLIFAMPGTAEQLRQFETIWNGMLSGNTAERRRTKIVPADTKTINTKDAARTDTKDQWEWLARVCCYALGMSPQPFVSMMNRATAESADQQAKEEGIGPHMRWVKSLMDSIIAHPLCFNSPDLEFIFESEDETDPEKKATIDDKYLRNGSVTLNEVRDGLGLDPIDDGDTHLIYTGQGAMLLDDVLNPPDPIIAQQVNPELPPPDGEVTKAGGIFHGNQHTGGIDTGRSLVVTPHSIEQARAAVASAEAAGATATANASNTPATHMAAAKAHKHAATAHHKAGNHSHAAIHHKAAAHHVKRARKAKKDVGTGELAKAKQPTRDKVLPIVIGGVDVPYGFGVSEDGERIYRDRRIPPVIKLSTGEWDVDLSTTVHELTEFEDIKSGYRYDVPGGEGAHQRATLAEDRIIRGMGHDPEEAQDALQPYLDAAYEAAKAGEAKQVPDDLATYPYEQEGELELIGMNAEKLAKRASKKKVYGRRSLTSQL